MARYRYGIGTVIHTNATFSDPDSETAPVDEVTGNELIDPTTVTCSVRAPNGTVTLYTYGVNAQLTRLSLGRFRLALTTNQIGTYRWTWTGSTSTRAVVFYGEADSY